MNTLVPFLIVSVLMALIFALVIWIVGKLGLGLDVDNFGAALLAAVVIAVVAGVLTILLSQVGMMDGGGFVGGVVYLLVAAAALLIGGRQLPGLRVAGFAGALVAAAAIGAIYWLGGLLLGQII